MKKSFLFFIFFISFFFISSAHAELDKSSYLPGDPIQYTKGSYPGTLHLVPSNSEGTELCDYSQPPPTTYNISLQDACGISFPVGHYTFKVWHTTGGVRQDIVEDTYFDVASVPYTTLIVQEPISGFISNVSEIIFNGVIITLALSAAIIGLWIVLSKFKIGY